MLQWYSGTDLQTSLSRRRPVRNRLAVVPACAYAAKPGLKEGFNGVQFLIVRGLINLPQAQTESRLLHPLGEAKQAVPLHRKIPDFPLKRRNLSVV